MSSLLVFFFILVTKFLLISMNQFNIYQYFVHNSLNIMSQFKCWVLIKISIFKLS